MKKKDLPQGYVPSIMIGIRFLSYLGVFLVF